MLVKPLRYLDDHALRCALPMDIAIDAIAAFPDSPAKQALVATAVFAVSRDH